MFVRQINLEPGELLLLDGASVRLLSDSVRSVSLEVKSEKPVELGVWNPGMRLLARKRRDNERP